MTMKQQPFTTLKFTGRRFTDHGLDLDVVPELTAYRRLIVESAKELWRRQHPKRVRVPKGFGDSIVIKFYGLEAGSTAVPLVRYIEQKALIHSPDVVDEAAELLNSAIEAASENRPPPSQLPRVILPLFEEFGKSLRANEAIVLINVSSARTAKYSTTTRQRILGWRNEPYRDEIDLSGEIRGTDLDGLSFLMKLDSGVKVQGRFSPEQESTVLEALRQHSTCRVRVRGVGEFSEEGNLKQVVRVHDFAVIEAEQKVIGLPSLLEAIASISDTVPIEAWKSVPSDLAQNLDGYLYGRSKARD